MVAAKPSSSKDGDQQQVSFHPDALVSMMSHAVKYPHQVLQGVLCGTFTAGGSVRILAALPLSHQALTQPLVEMALGLVTSTTIPQNPSLQVVGWYTAPRLLADTRPGPVALRMVANLAATANNNKTTTTAADPVLVVLQNTALAAWIQAGDKAASPGAEKVTWTSLVQVYGRDFADQWLESRPSSLCQLTEKDDEASLATQWQQTWNERQAMQSTFADLEDYLDQTTTDAPKSSSTLSSWPLAGWPHVLTALQEKK